MIISAILSDGTVEYSALENICPKLRFILLKAHLHFEFIHVNFITHTICTPIYNYSYMIHEHQSLYSTIERNLFMFWDLCTGSVAIMSLLLENLKMMTKVSYFRIYPLITKGEWFISLLCYHPFVFHLKCNARRYIMYIWGMAIRIRN